VITRSEESYRYVSHCVQSINFKMRGPGPLLGCSATEEDIYSNEATQSPCEGQIHPSTAVYFVQLEGTINYVCSYSLTLRVKQVA
jgi:hypothetical protein